MCDKEYKTCGDWDSESSEKSSQSSHNYHSSEEYSEESESLSESECHLFLTKKCNKKDKKKYLERFESIENRLSMITTLLDNFTIELEKFDKRLCLMEFAPPPQGGTEYLKILQEEKNEGFIIEN